MTQPNPSPQRIAEVAAGLSPKAAAALSYGWPRAKHLLHPAHRRWFERHGIANEGYSRWLEGWAYFLSPLGIAVRNHLKGQSDE